MINGERVIAVIPARGGSKSVPMKNIKNLGGRPLLAWAIEVAQGTPEIDRIIISTDDNSIRSVGLKYGAESYIRPYDLATDESLVIDALRNLIETLKQEGERASIMVVLEPTCPLRNASDVRACLDLMIDEGVDSVATFKKADLNPHRAWKINHGKPQVFIPGAIPWLPRQKLPEAFQLNGAVYAFKMSCLTTDSPSLLVGKVGAVIMPAERSVDIDDEFDFTIVEAVIRRKKLGGNA